LRQHAEARQGLPRGLARRVSAVAAPYRLRLLAFLALIIADALVSASFPLVYRGIIDNGILRHNARVVVQLAILIAALAVVDGGLTLWQQLISARLGSSLILGLRSKIFSHIQRLPVAFFSSTKTGALVTRLNNDVLGVQQAFTGILSSLVGNSITIAATVVAMFVLSWPIALASLITLPIFLACSRWVGKRLQAVTREYYSVTAQMNVTLTERLNVAGAMLMKLFGRSHDEATFFGQQAARLGQITVIQAMYARLLMTSLLLSGALSTALAYGWGGVMAVRGTFGVGTVVALTAYLVRLYGPFTALSSAQLDAMTALVSFDRVFEILDFPPAIVEHPDAVTIPRGPAAVEFDHVAFRYPPSGQASLASLTDSAVQDKGGSEQVLFDVSFTAEPGQFIAIVGPSGAGKTTISHLVPRLHDVQAGAVRVSGVDVRNATADSLLAVVGVVTQDAHLFHDSIRANLLYAKPDATDTELTEALAAAQILPLVESLPDGLDTVVGDHGYRLSGGEKQRIAVARLLLKAPDIVILDEATAHLDSESEAVLQRSLRAALRGRTSLVIAHRLSTVLQADLILVISQGRVTERGTHAELLGAGGLYAGMYRLQAAAQLTAAAAYEAARIANGDPVTPATRGAPAPAALPVVSAGLA
jgi:ATP-binding cassette subfamily B protein